MTDLPWFPFYVDDFLGSPKVRIMTDAEIGVYLLLLIEQFQAGHVRWPCERKANALRTQCERIEYVLAQCFEEEGGVWYNRKLQSIMREQLSKSEKARASARARWSRKQAGPDANALRTQSERNANQNQKPEAEPDTESETERDEVDADVFGSLSEYNISAIKGLYGWADREGTDERVWNGQTMDERVRCIQIAVQRLEGEGKTYNNRFFRSILIGVIDEQHSEEFDPYAD